MQAVGHHCDVIKAREQGNHLQNGTASIKNDRIAIMDKTNGSFCNQLFLVGVDECFMIDRRIGFLFIQHHSAISTNDGSCMFQNDQIFANGCACGVKVLRQFFNRAFPLLLQVLQNGGLTLTRFHGRDYLI